MENKEFIAKAGFTFPQLTGSEKQVSWAGDIRERYLVDILCSYVDGPFPGIKSARQRKKMEVLVEKINQKTEAKWWIDNRHDLRRLLKK